MGTRRGDGVTERAPNIQRPVSCRARAPQRVVQACLPAPPALAEVGHDIRVEPQSDLRLSGRPLLAARAAALQNLHRHQHGLVGLRRQAAAVGLEAGGQALEVALLHLIELAQQPGAQALPALVGVGLRRGRAAIAHDSDAEETASGTARRTNSRAARPAPSVSCGASSPSRTRSSRCCLMGLIQGPGGRSNSSIR